MLDSDDNFVEYGTPLEPLEEDDVSSKKPILVSDQIAVDEQGRRRFHGAFTGGFSAGYYNTVGSKEGWTPATFKSSREGRDTAATSRVTQNVHDFMDEEDMGAFGIAPQILRNTNEFEQRESRKRTRHGPEQEGPIPGVPVLEQIIKPVTDTVGMRILQRMGWRPGKGVGPKVGKRDRKSQKKETTLKDIALNNEGPVHDDDEGDTGSSARVYGCFVPPELRKADNNSDTDDSFEYEEFTFAPDDLDNPLCNPKENAFGLGYSGLDRTALSFGPIDLFGSQFTGRVENKKLKIRGEAFGIGAFEDQDEEVYSRDDLSQYDFALETPEERQTRLRKDKNAKKQKGAEKSESGLIPGFVRSKKPAPEKKYFRPPHLPKDFQPIHLIRKSRFETGAESVASSSTDSGHRGKQKQGLDRHALTIEERQVLLGEAKERIPISKEEQEAKAKEELEATQKEEAKAKAERLKKFAEVLQAYTSNKPNEVDTLGRPAFKPFMKNPEKQDRYEKYMALVTAGYKECIGDLQPPEMTEWEREREKMEFERASALYKPIAGVMSSRFVSAKSHDISHVVPIKETIKENDPTQDPLVAAKMNLFGKLTHRVFEWHPDRLLSKRFNVPHPHPDSKMVGVRRAPELRAVAAQGQNVDPPKTFAPPATKKSLFDNIDFSKPPPGLLPAGTSSSYSNTPEENLLAPGTETEEQFSTPAPALSVNTSLSLSQEPPPPIPPKPSIDLFKEIFQNSSSESEEEEPEVPPAVSNTKTIPIASGSGLMRRDDRAGHSSSTTSQRQGQDKSEIKVKGIFDNLNFSKLDTVTKPTAMPEPTSSHSSAAAARTHTHIKDSSAPFPMHRTNEISDEDEEDIYGPTLPAQPSVKVKAAAAATALSSSSAKPSTNLSQTKRSEDKGGSGDEEWVEVERNESNRSRKRTSSSSKRRESNKSAHSHSHKKKKSHSHHKSKSKKKNSKSKKDHKSSKSKKIKKRRRETKSSSSSSGSDEDGSGSSQDDLSPILIHQSVSHKALLSKLKEITQFR